MIGKFLASVFFHAASAAIAFVATGAVHTLSGRALWAIFPWAYQVRQFSVYLLDVIPFYVLIFAVVSSAWQIFRGTVSLRFTTLLALALLAAPLSALAHQPFFPSGDRAMLLLVVYAIFYASALAALQGAVTAMVKSKGHLAVWPWAPAVLPGLFGGLILSALYVGGFQLARQTGYLAPQNETYNEQRAPSSPKDQFRESEPPNDQVGAAPSPDLFEVEEISLEGLGGIGRGSTGVVDVNADGLFDFVARDVQGTLSIWINNNGVLHKKETFIEALAGKSVSTFSFVDYDRDGLLDLFVAQPVSPPQTVFENTFLKKLFWYPSRQSATVGRLFRQTKDGQWQDVTTAAFPDGRPQQFRKTEPILWFDFNADGRLDFVWSGYPHPRGGGQSLYVQNADGTFSDKINEILTMSANRVYAEGSDIGDIDGDGDIDFFAYGFLFRNDDGHYVQVCDDQMPGMHCDAEARNEEGALFEDIDGDGTLDFVLSYHGAGGIIPKYYLQLFRGDQSAPGGLKRDKTYERQFYGFNTYLRGKDFDLNGRPDILTNDPGRLLTHYNDKWVDMLGAIGSKPDGDMWPLGWLDIEEDGDWDFLALRVSDGKAFLFRNNLNPQRFMKISMRGPGGIDNQYGATLRIDLPGGKRAVASYRPMGGYQGITDPRLVYPLKAGFQYRFEVCFASLQGVPSASAIQGDVMIEVDKVSDRCATYLVTPSDGATRLDLTFIAGTG